MTNYPTAWQRRVLWTSGTIIAVVAVGAIATGLIVLLGRVAGFLQPVLIPFAVAAVLAFLLEPVVRFLSAKTRLSRTYSVAAVFALISLLLALLFVSIVPRIYDSTGRMIRDMPAYTQKAQQRLLALLESSQRQLDRLNHLLPQGAASSPESPSPAGAPPGSSPGASPAGGSAEQADQGRAADQPQSGDLRGYIQKQLPALGKEAPAMLETAFHMALGSIGGAFGIFGTLLNAIIVPVYLFFMLNESPNIARRWTEYVPLRASPMKTEVVSVVTEINGYLVAFFRGQLIVSTLDGIMVGVSLAIMGLDFAFFIGLLVVVLTFIPYLGIVLCYIPAILVAIIQYGDWQHPAMVVGIMFTVQMLEGYLIAPKIVGESTGLHPMTVIVSVFFWSLLLNGAIGAILAVPLTATLKVLARRYVWERSRHASRLVPVQEAAPVLAAGGAGAVAPAGPVTPPDKG